MPLVALAKAGAAFFGGWLEIAPWIERLAVAGLALV